MQGTYTGNIPANDRLGIPALKMQDGPQGFRTSAETGGDGTSTAWPSALTIAASWDADLVYRWATAMAEEFGDKGANMALAPGLGMARVPTAGRNFEYLSGEDPILGAVMAKSSVKGFQDHGIIANAKHWVNNEIEEHRMSVSANVNERVRFELYYPPFEAAAEAGVVSVMCAYNRINDVYACQNNDTLTHLREYLGFDGWVVSDWTATKSSVQSIKAGLDQEMPVGVFYNPRKLEALLASRDISEDDIDRSVRRVLSAMDKVGLFDKNRKEGDPMANVTSAAHNALAREIVAKSTVLLQNTDNILPFDAAVLGDCIAVIGDEQTISGGGSGYVSPPYIITAQTGIRAALANSKTQVIYNSGKDISSAVALAQQCVTAVVVVTTTSSEGGDRSDLSLGDAQNNLVSAIAAVNARTVVDVVTPGAVLMPWCSEVKAVLVSWMPGQEAGNGLADVLFGAVNPSGRLPVTMPNKDNEVGFSAEQYPGVGRVPEAYYSEELLIGYRWYDANQIAPRFPFGHGLSYTSFAYSALSIRAVSPFSSKEENASGRTKSVVSVTVQNTGARDGDEIVQLYLQFPAQAGEPPKQLRAFQKVSLKSQASTTVEFALTAKQCSIWDSEAHRWDVVQGTFTAFVGASSRDLRLQQDFVIA